MKASRKYYPVLLSSPRVKNETSHCVGIPVRTLEDWEAGRRTPPEYIPRLIAYQLKYEELIRKMSVQDIADNSIEEGKAADERLQR